MKKENVQYGLMGQCGTILAQNVCNLPNFETCYLFVNLQDGNLLSGFE